MESNHDTASTNPYVQFLFAGEPVAFLVDTNLTLGEGIFIALVYPSIHVGVEKPWFHAVQGNHEEMAIVWGHMYSAPVHMHTAVQFRNLHLDQMSLAAHACVPVTIAPDLAS